MNRLTSIVEGNRASGRKFFVTDLRDLWRFAEDDRVIDLDEFTDIMAMRQMLA